MLQRKITYIGFISILMMIFLAGSISISGQTGGTNTSQKKNSDNKADENLKSLAHINPSTLAMEMSVPFMSYPGRNGNSLPVGLSYSSKLWRMRTKGTYFYFLPSSSRRQYVTQLEPTFAERSVAGWTSSVAFPVIEEKLEFYNQSGNTFDLGSDMNFFDTLYQTATNTEPTAGLVNNPNLPCGYVCVERTRWWTGEAWTEWQCTGYDWNTANCGSGGGSSSGDCYYQNGYCPASCSYCVERPTCPTWNPNCGPQYPENPVPPEAQRTHYVKRVNVRMGDGSVHEFRKSDAVFGYCAGGANDGPNCETLNPDNWGMFLAVDGSGMKLERTTDGSTLYLPNGGRYLFPNGATGNFDGATLYQSNIFIDADGNRSTFEATTAQNQFAANDQRLRKMTDTLGREIYDPLPQNLMTQMQEEGDQTISLPGLNGNATQNYELKWRYLKPVPCPPENPTCGNLTEGALENQSENVYFYSSSICFGSNESSVDPNNQYPNQKLFPQHGWGLRACNPSTGTPNLTPLRFNPVVLAGIELPNGKSYTFKYNQYGEITKIIYPTGSYETFKYEGIPPLSDLNSPTYNQTNRGVVEQRVYDSNGVLQQRRKYSATFTNGTNPTYTVTTIQPKQNTPIDQEPMVEGIKTQRILQSEFRAMESFGFNNPLVGMPKEERTYDENGVLRSRTLTEYTVKGPVPTDDPSRPAYADAKRDARAKRTISVAMENGLALASLNETEYETPGENGSLAPTDPEYFAHLNARRTKGYHYAVIDLNTAQSGTLEQIAGYFNNNLLASVSETDYEYDANYKARGIRSLPVETRVLNPANTAQTVAKTRTVYDNQLPAANANYPYSTENYSIGGSFNCPSGTQSVVCWQSPGSSALGRPTTSRLWDDDNNQWIETHTRFDIFGNAVKVKDAAGNEAETIFENTTAKPYLYAYPTKVITPAPDPTNTTGTNQTSTAETTYDLMTGLVLEAKNDFGQITKTEYNDSLLRPTRSYAVNFTAPEAQTIYNDTALWVKTRKQIDANNWDEAITYSDSLGRTIKTQAKDSQGDVFTETEYDFLGRVKRTTNPYREGETKLWSKPRYDEMGRAVESFAPAPDGQTGASLGITEYGISTQAEFFGTYVLTTDASGRKSRALTNALGQLVRVDEPSSTNTLEPLPQATPTPNPSPTPTRTPRYDPPTCYGGTQTCLNGTSEYPSVSTYYTYNEQGKMVVVQQGGQFRYFKYDSLGRLIRVRQPEQEVNNSLDLADNYNTTGKWTAKFTYDLMGNVLTAVDANGTTITNTYDKANRITTKTYANEPNGQTTPAVQYFYDGKGLDNSVAPRVGTVNPAFAKGKLTKVTSSVSETRYTQFDYLGRLLQMEQRTPVSGETLSQATPRVSSYQYNFAGALAEETYPSGRTVKNEFETDGDLSRISGKSSTPNAFEQTYANGFSYTPDGKIQRLKLGNGRWESAKFNERLQVTELALGTSDGNGSLWKLAYEYGELQANGTVDVSKNTGNIAKQTLSFNGLTNPLVQSYKYDSLYRLTEAKETSSANQTWKEAFSYDRYGNRTGKEKFVGTTQLTNDNKTHPTIDPLTNRFNIGQGYQYDKNGNLVDDAEGRTFIFNGENKQRFVVKNNANVGEYSYDGEGKRVKKKVYEADGITVKEETVFVYSAGKLVAEYSTKPPPTNPTTSYTVTDQLLSPRVITDSYGNVVSRRDFQPFGEDAISNTGERPASLKYGATDSVRQKFTGYLKDDETQLDFAEARMYESRHGRFTAVDPLLASGKSANPQTFNRYTYVLNNPIIFTDPTGLQTNSNPNRRTGFQGDVYTDGNGLYYRNPGEGRTLFTGTTTVTDDGGTWTVIGSGENRGIYPYQSFSGGDRDDGYDSPPLIAGEEYAQFRPYRPLRLPNAPRSRWEEPREFRLSYRSSALQRMFEQSAFNRYDAFSRMTGGNGLPCFLPNSGTFIGPRNPIDTMGPPSQPQPSARIFGMSPTSGSIFRSESSLLPNEKEMGAYFQVFSSGKFYAGKGPFSRMIRSQNIKENTYNDLMIMRFFFPRRSANEAFIQEQLLINRFGGPLSVNPNSPTYNKINQPGRRLLEQLEDQ